MRGELSVAALTVGLALGSAPCAGLAQTLYWTVSEAQLAGHSGDVPLLDKNRNVVARVPTQRLTKLLRVKEKIASAAGQYGVVLSVSNDNEANAYAGRPNGQATVIFTIPMLNRLGDDEELIAAIMAHEFGHLNYNHTGRSERRAASTAIGIIAGIAAGLFIPGPLASTLAANAVDLTGKALIHSYDRDQEREADAYGVDIMAKAGYDPQAAVRLWSASGSFNGGGGLFSTHPATDERFANVQRLVAALTSAPASQKTETAAAVAAPSASPPPAPNATRAESETSPQISAAEAKSTETPATVPEVAWSAPPQGSTSQQVDAPAQAAEQTAASDGGTTTVVSMATMEQKSSDEALAYARNGLAVAKSEQGLWGYKDSTGKWAIAPTFQHARPFDDQGLAAVAVGAPGDVRWGFINSSGNWEISARFDDARSFGEDRAGYAKVRVGSEAFGQTKYISRSGEVTDHLP